MLLIKNFVGFILPGFIFIFIIPANFSCKKDSNSNQNNANIVYTDLSPDSLITGNGDLFSLDLNNDGISDFRLETFYGRLPCLIGGPIGQEFLMPIIKVQISPYGTNSIGDTTLAEVQFPIMLNEGREINQQTFNWSDSGAQVMVAFNQCAKSITGLWSDSQDQFLPLQLEIGTSSYFGWIRLGVGVYGVTVTVKDYAINSLANQPIFAGQTK